ncbi:hypothetical protein A3C91_04155 [Candidatus Azambacteria bacterium RIFCSPHIGHO2_02_FULL_52_12]|uniref:Response regulatory domain-containing protein n=1 Tax=Candidatus Azambacteria bacterium RIFCSPLOWO2_01_FULL_46_25 TaxID=1797298 RepID=A0A1F5BUW7_9BACT|nr:MAG: hypothetical protein A3C91_04155 [Candidatus Azambacteria bacterium RIFCSPHIGHO2_02_FULL_52_12]OGD34436.1 MAG: hypothetical protein A2988_02840 [Candidatus Azambacteria bacterium RIFCSPLOWO2_01_FULL_46_25]OGD37286.1 MAG: hypothetical protein A2850_01050 [Candidatus Azambacteria bacterium RIFCSPHIGHO2_01_FULL_51_74]
MDEPKKMKIALIEDEEVLSSVLENKLKKEGFEVFTAMDGEAGLALITAIRPDLILLDILMPKMDGFGVLTHLSQDKELAKIPVIIISNSGQPVEIDKALALGVKDYLVKAEFDPQEVLDKIKKQLHMPSAPSEAVAQTPEEKAKRIDVKAFRILLVEDDNFLRDLIYHKMTKEGFTVEQGLDGEDGLKKAIESKPHLILLDLILPGIDGFEVLKKIREEETIKQVPVIILSNLGQKDDIEKGMKLGATDYLIKAHNTPGEIIEKVRGVLAKSYPGS